MYFLPSAFVSIVLVLLASSVAPAQAVETGTRRMAITFDDLPAQSTQQTTAVFESVLEAILSHAKMHGAPLLGLVNEQKLYQGGDLVAARVEPLKRWLEAGHDLGNHTYSHLDLHRTPVQEYLEDIVRGETVLRRLLEGSDPAPLYFRHPMLHTGRDAATRSRVLELVSSLGYRIAPVTIDNGEWIFARAYDLALDRGEQATAQRVASSYLEYMDAVVDFYEAQSRKILGYELPQILLLHANRLNASAGSDLLQLIAARGYRWITVGEALEDPAFEREDRYFGPAGITWLHRWALTEGLDRAVFRGEPEVPAWILAYSEL